MRHESEEGLAVASELDRELGPDRVSYLRSNRKYRGAEIPEEMD